MKRISRILGVNGVAHAVHALLRPCEFPLRKNQKSPKFIVAASTKQSPFTNFAAKYMKEDCFVARFLQISHQCHVQAFLNLNAPRNDEVERNVAITLM
jgi:hypothetical protein